MLFGKSVYTLDSMPPDVIARDNSTGTGYRNPTPTPEVIEAGPITLSPEFVNYLLAMIIYSLRYAAVFWYTNATFSATFAAILLVATVHNIFAYCGMGVLYKFSVNLHAIEGVELVLSNTAVLILYLCACAVMFCSMLSIFNYGYCHYVETCRAFLKTHFPTYARYVAKMPVGCQGYVPHLVATVTLILYVALRAPVVYDYVTLYRKTGFDILLTCIIIDAVYMLMWIAVWFAFTVKQTWDFSVNPQMDIIQQPQRTAGALAVSSSRQNGQPPQAEVTVIGSHGDKAQEPPTGNHSDTPARHLPTLQEDDKDMKDGYESDEKDVNVPESNGQRPEKPPHSKKPKLSINVGHPEGSNDTALNDQVQTPVSPASALKKSGLRKSGERRHQQPQRVTFDDSVDQLTPSKVPHDNEEKKPIQFTPRKKKPRDKPVEKFYDPVRTNSRTKQQPEPMRVEEIVQNRTQDLGDYTPENTLTRNYRHSLRDKCGQYYKGAQDLGMAPAAQSSPLPRNRPVSDSYDMAPEEIMLNPLTAGNGKYGPTQHHNNNNSIKTLPNSSSQQPPQTVGKDYFHQRAKSSDARYDARAGVDRLRDPKRLSGRKQNEDSRAFSYPPQLSPSSSHHLPNKQSIQASPHHQLQLPGEAHLRNYSPSSHSPNSSKDTSNHSTSSAGTARDPKMFLQLGSHYDTPSSLKVPSAKGLGHMPLTRPLKINTKPDLTRRDSALPSSNETSSNESADHVLCSQV